MVGTTGTIISQAKAKAGTGTGTDGVGITGEVMDGEQVGLDLMDLALVARNLTGRYLRLLHLCISQTKCRQQGIHWASGCSKPRMPRHTWHLHWRKRLGKFSGALAGGDDCVDNSPTETSSFEGG